MSISKYYRVSTLLESAWFSLVSDRNWTDRRFYRKRYDAQQVLVQFAITARGELDMNALTAELARGAGDDSAGWGDGVVEVESKPHARRYPLIAFAPSTVIDRGFRQTGPYCK